MPGAGTRETKRLRVGGAVVAVVLGSALALAAPSSAVLGEADEPRAWNVELVGHSDLGGRGLHAGVWAHRNFAYVGTWGQRGGTNPALCPGWGVAVVDIADPTRPIPIGSVAERPGTSAEDVQVLAVESPAFSGDLLATGFQRCAGEGVGGLSLWDVTDPRAPAELGFFDTGSGPAGVHEFFMFRRGGRTIALLAVPFSESLDPQGQGDLRIVDVTDPRAPVQVAHWGANRGLGLAPRDGLGRDSQNYAHSVRASTDGRFAYVSYWDAGVIILDISDPASPRYVGRTTFSPNAEGNAHSTALARGGRILVQADEDPYIRRETLVVEGLGSDELVDARYGAFRPLVPGGEGVGGRATYVGRGCPAGRERAEDPYPADPAGMVAIVDRGDCTFVDKVLRAQRSGAVGVVIANFEPRLINPDGDPGEVTIPAGVVDRESGERLKAAIGRGEAVTIRFSADQTRFDDWGYLRFWDVDDPANPVQLGTFATANARTDREKGPPDEGWYTVHDPVVLGDRLYASWYSDGVRVIDIADPTRPHEIGSFVPPRGEPRPGQAVGRSARPFVWGVYVRGDLILASDQHTGLYILRDRSR